MKASCGDLWDLGWTTLDHSGPKPAPRQPRPFPRTSSIHQSPADRGGGVTQRGGPMGAGTLAAPPHELKLEKSQHTNNYQYYYRLLQYYYSTTVLAEL